GRAEKELDQLLQTTFFGRPSRRAEAARPKAQKQTETGRPTRTPGTSSTLGSLGGSERHGGAVAEAMPALRREPAAKARPGAYGRGAAGGSGDRSASGEGAPHRVSVSQRGLWALRKGDAGAAARGDQRGLWTAVDGADRLLEGSLPVAAAAGGSHAGRGAGPRDQFGEYPESLGRSQPGGRTARSAVAGAVAAPSGPECGGDGVADPRRQALDLGAGGEPVCVLCGGLHARRRSAGIVVGRGFPRHSLQRSLGGLLDVPFRADAVMLGSPEEEHSGDCRLCVQPLGAAILPRRIGDCGSAVPSLV